MITTKHKTDSATKVNFSEREAYKYVSGVRGTVGFKADLGVYKRFKQLSKHVYGSTCKAFEIYMLSFISGVENGVNFCNTGKPLNIEQHIVIERNIRTRRKLVVEEEEVVEKIVTRKCFVCNRAAVGEALHDTGKQVLACEKHLAELKRHPKWTVIPVE